MWVHGNGYGGAPANSFLICMAIAIFHVFDILKFGIKKMGVSLIFTKDI